MQKDSEQERLIAELRTALEENAPAATLEDSMRRLDALARVRSTEEGGSRRTVHSSAVIAFLALVIVGALLFFRTDDNEFVIEEARVSRVSFSTLEAHDFLDGVSLSSLSLSGFASVEIPGLTTSRSGENLAAAITAGQNVGSTSIRVYRLTIPPASKIILSTFTRFTTIEVRNATQPIFLELEVPPGFSIRHSKGPPDEIPVESRAPERVEVHAGSVAHPLVLQIRNDNQVVLGSNVSLEELLFLGESKQASQFESSIFEGTLVLPMKADKRVNIASPRKLVLRGSALGTFSIGGLTGNNAAIVSNLVGQSDELKTTVGGLVSNHQLSILEWISRSYPAQLGWAAVLFLWSLMRGTLIVFGKQR